MDAGLLTLSRGQGWSFIFAGILLFSQDVAFHLNVMIIHSSTYPLLVALSKNRRMVDQIRIKLVPVEERSVVHPSIPNMCWLARQFILYVDKQKSSNSLVCQTLRVHHLHRKYIVMLTLLVV